MEKDVYILHQSGALSIVDEEIAEHCIRQARSGGRKVKVFRDRDKFLAYEAQMQEEAAKMRLQMMGGAR